MIRGMLIAAAWGVICAAALAAVVTGEERSGREVKVVCFGDSITEGYSVDGQLKTTYPGLLQGVLDEIEGKGRFKVVNCGISGQDTRQGLARIQALAQLRLLRCRQQHQRAGWKRRAPVRASVQA